jgi:enterochelin esterase-like enzyme
MDMGTAEEQKELDHSRYLDRQIRKKFPHLKNYEYREFNRAGHNEFAWRRRMPVMLKYLFGTGK